MKYICLTGYYPSKHQIIIQANTISAITDNVINENSKGSTIYAGAAIFQVLEEPAEIINILAGANAT